MNCPKCGSNSIKTLDSRPCNRLEDLPNISRRRKICNDCEHRFTTIEAPLEELGEWIDNNFSGKRRSASHALKKLHVVGRAKLEKPKKKKTAKKATSASKRRSNTKKEDPQDWWEEEKGPSTVAELAAELSALDE